MSVFEAPYWLIKIVTDKDIFACVVNARPCDVNLLQLTMRLECMFDQEQVVVESLDEADPELPYYDSGVDLLGQIASIVPPSAQTLWQNDVANLISGGFVEVTRNGEKIDAWTFWALSQTEALKECDLSLTDKAQGALDEHDA